MHNQEFKTLSGVNINCASTTKSSNNVESIQVCKSKKLNAKPSTPKVAKKKKSKSAQMSSDKSTCVESKQFQKLQSNFCLNPNSGVLESSTKMPTNTASTSIRKSKACQCQACYTAGIQCTCKKKEKKIAANSEANI